MADRAVHTILRQSRVTQHSAAGISGSGSLMYLKVMITINGATSKHTNSNSNAADFLFSLPFTRSYNLLFAYEMKHKNR